MWPSALFAPEEVYDVNKNLRATLLSFGVTMYFMVSYLISIYLSLIGYLPLWVCLRPHNLVFINYFFQFFSFSVYTSVNKWYVLYSSYIKLNPGIFHSVFLEKCIKEF